MRPVEAVRATGSPFLSVVIMSVLPQVMPRFIGFSAYQLDSNLRNSALVGLVGGGGIGSTLFTAFQRFDYDFVLTIVIAIIAIIMVGELLSGWMRKAVPMTDTTATPRARHDADVATILAARADRALELLPARDRRSGVVAALDRDHPRIPLRRAAADRRSVRPHVADRLGLVSEGRAARTHRDAAHRNPRHDPGGRNGGAGRADGGAQHHALGRCSTASAASSWSRRARCMR